MESLGLVIACIFANISLGYCNRNYNDNSEKPEIQYSTPRRENVTNPKDLLGRYSQPNRRVKRGK